MTIGHCEESRCFLVFLSVFDSIWRLTLLKVHFGYPHARRASSTWKSSCFLSSVSVTRHWLLSNKVLCALTAPTMQPERTMSSTGLKRRWSTESQSVLPDGSKRPYTSERKDNRPWAVMRATTNWATHTTTFLTRRLPVVSRTGRTEYQLFLMKAYDRGRNVKF